MQLLDILHIYACFLKFFLNTNPKQVIPTDWAQPESKSEGAHWYCPYSAAFLAARQNEYSSAGANSTFLGYCQEGRKRGKWKDDRILICVAWLWELKNLIIGH